MSDIKRIIERVDLPEGTDVETVAAHVTLAEVDLPEEIRDNLALFLRLVRRVLEEYDPSLRSAFDILLTDAIAANADDAEETRGESEAFARLVSFIDDMVEMEFRQHSVVHARALEDIREHGRWGERGELDPMVWSLSIGGFPSLERFARHWYRP